MLCEDWGLYIFEVKELKIVTTDIKVLEFFDTKMLWY